LFYQYLQFFEDVNTVTEIAQLIFKLSTRKKWKKRSGIF